MRWKHRIAVGVVSLAILTGVVPWLVSHGLLDPTRPVRCRHCGSFDIHIVVGSGGEGHKYTLVNCMNPECLAAEQVVTFNGRESVTVRRPSRQELPTPASDFDPAMLDPCTIADMTD